MSETRVKIQSIVQNQLPDFIAEENPLLVDFLKQYYISQEYTGGPIDLVDNLDQYLKLDNLTPEVIQGVTNLESSVTSSDATISVKTTKGFPNEYGLLRIGSEVISYTGITTNTFTGCQRGFSGISEIETPGNPEYLTFTDSSSTGHLEATVVVNLGFIYLNEFYKKFKAQHLPGVEDRTFAQGISVENINLFALTLFFISSSSPGS